jgi:Amt family ammonium transporter
VLGNGAFLVKELIAVALSSVWAFAFTYGMLWLIDRFTPVKVDQAAEEGGLDAALHGESAYLGT